MNTGICLNLFSILWGTYPEVELLDHMVIFCILILEEPQNCFPHSCAVFIHTSNAQGFQLFHILTNTYFQESFLKIASLVVVKSHTSLWF